ncbi:MULTISPECIES: GNAT family N-acetyltransferase [unclassified Paenibacillus]|uniref:GNAT family N-acetyltransferase n=1 Tax=unclassified Paenibacillus TaxID=185978 RepID=UPI000953E678|nr:MULTISPECIES: GNAT family N-acetyltransferase [unclassified Paenibacillus]ASS68948.1 GNAT family N-acetyltransferase [Paenibacillus sp. RUD330]SIR13633.1 Acetyltransferase (GNAT) family protein [Paenibacillus sp. RU4X]SIR24042.1 Acetyltransferase (GNAT) family protein [Paenibacillus sp. RU4T]
MNRTSDSITVSRCDAAHAVAPLFDQYRIFYGQPSDEEGARLFLQARLERGESVLFAAAAEGVPIGFAQLYPVFSSVSMRRVWILNDLYVHAEWRGRGAAKLLLQAVRDYAAAGEARSVQLSTAADNSAARSLYEQAGYELDTVFLTYELLLEKA